jgi:hypothetical protein
MKMRQPTAAVFLDNIHPDLFSMSTVSHTSTMANEPATTITAVWEDKTLSSEIAKPELIDTHEHRYLHGYQLVVVTL